MKNILEKLETEKQNLLAKLSGIDLSISELNEFMEYEKQYFEMKLKLESKFNNLLSDNSFNSSVYEEEEQKKKSIYETEAEEEQAYKAWCDTYQDQKKDHVIYNRKSAYKKSELLELHTKQLFSDVDHYGQIQGSNIQIIKDDDSNNFIVINHDNITMMDKDELMDNLKTTEFKESFEYYLKKHIK